MRTARLRSAETLDVQLHQGARTPVFRGAGCGLLIVVFRPDHEPKPFGVYTVTLYDTTGSVWASINSLGAVQSGIPATTYDATVWGSNSGNAPTSLTFNTPFTDVLTSKTTATAEHAVQVQLVWQYNN